MWVLSLISVAQGLISKQLLWLDSTIALIQKPLKKHVWFFFLLDKEKGGSVTVGDFEIAAKYGEWNTNTH